MQSQNFNRVAIAAAVLGALGLGYGLSNHEPPATAPAPAAPPAAVAPAAPVKLPDFSSIVAENGKAVVNISVSGNRQVNATEYPGDSDDPFQDFFRRFGPPAAPQGEMPARGLGSGFIVRPDGVIITNAHVVEGANEVTVKLTDKREFHAKVVGLDKPTDTAVLKIEANDLPTVRTGDPAASGVGDWVLAIGSPFGFENTVTAGIISGKSRSLPDEGYVPFIQTDVAVNPGNSGGPLFNLKGEVIGINSQIYSRTGGYQGLSFAVPIDVALKVEHQLLDNGKVSRGRLGISIQELNQSLADSFGLEKPEGALVGSVPADGPAIKAGIQPGDVILQLNGRKIQSSNELPPLVADLKPGTEAVLGVWRGGKQLEISVPVGEAPQSEPLAMNAAEAPQGRLGLAVRPVQPGEAPGTDVAGGLLVERVAGPAAKAGIRPGDVVLAVNGQPVSNAGELREQAARADKRLALLVQRGNTRMFVPLELG